MLGSWFNVEMTSEVLLLVTVVSMVLVEFVAVPKNLVAKILTEFQTRMRRLFTGAMLQRIRLAAPTIGEKIAVFGLGLLGLLTIQILKANGCEVIAFDISEESSACERLGVFSAVIADGVSPVGAAEFSDGLGMDAVLITAATSSDPIDAAAKMSRQRGRIILVGVSGLNLSRLEFSKRLGSSLLFLWSWPLRSWI